MTQPNTNKELARADLLPLKDICEILVRHFGYTEGLWDMSIEMSFALGAVGPSPDKVLPGAMLGISRIGISRAKMAGPHTVDASKIPVPATDSKRPNLSST